MTVETRAVRRPSAAELQQAWRALTSGEYAVGRANSGYAVSGTNSTGRSAGWVPAAGESVLPLIGCPGSFGATTVAVAITTVAGERSRVVECCPPAASGLAAAADAELGVDGSGWRRGRRGGVVLDRCADIAQSVPDVPPPAECDAGLTVVDVCWDPTVVLASSSWLADVVRRAPTVVAVAAATAPALRQLDVLAALLQPVRLLVVAVGRPVRRWPAAARRTIGPVAEAALTEGRLVTVPIVRRWAATGLTADPLPARILTAIAPLLPFILDREGT